MCALKINQRLLRALRERVNVRLPNGEVFALDKAPATSLTKAVLEVFAVRFLRLPAAVRVLQPGRANKVCGTDHTVAVHLPATAASALPEVVLADVSPKQFMLVFIAVVPDSAKGGEINAARKAALLQASHMAGLSASDIRLVSAFSHRAAPTFRRAGVNIAWGTFAWFSSEPSALLGFHEGECVALSPPSFSGGP